MNNIKELVLKTRSYRRFDNSAKLSAEDLVSLIEITRYTASAANLQPLKYIASAEPKTNSLINSTLAWAGYIKDWEGPEPDEQPAGYIVVLTDQQIKSNADIDIGISAQTILLAASERGLGGCIFSSIKRDKLKNLLEIPDYLAVSIVIAIGKPIEKVVIEDISPGASIKYYRDSESVHHVPKRKLEEILLKTY
ncbi:MAG: nitroreductase family protein [Spirochaetes bacterium]|nr:nitroreductase family protein [Spirochaetota bacterium]